MDRDRWREYVSEEERDRIESILWPELQMLRSQYPELDHHLDTIERGEG